MIVACCLTVLRTKRFVYVLFCRYEELEQRKDELGIASYGASITTMEEVFMRYYLHQISVISNQEKVIHV